MNIARGHYLTRRFGFAFKWSLRALAANEPLQVFGNPKGPDSGCIEAVYIINLDRQPSRWKNFTGEARRQAIEGGEDLLSFCHRVSAVDGKLLDEGEVNDSVAATYPLDAQYYVDPDPRLLTLIREKAVHISMTQEEIAVALSHVKTWRRIVAEERSYALVLEDDVFFEKGFAAQLNRSWGELPRRRNNGPKFGLLYLSFREVEQGAQRVLYSRNLYCPIRGYWWLSGYVLSNAGAKKLLELLPVAGPVDLWMNHHYSDLEVYSTPRSLISQRTDLQSTNRYSILPLLSQLGVQSDKTHLVLQQIRGRRPVFGVGFDREGAGILESALSLLGYRCCNDRWGLLSANVGQILDKNLPLLFDAYVRVRSVSRAFRKLHALYPDAAFILPPAPQEGSELSPEEYRAVRTHFLGKEDKLLAFNARDVRGWRTLCNFLCCARPSHLFPTDGVTNDIPALSCGFVQRTPVANLGSSVLEHDVHPWILPYERMSAFGILHDIRACGTQAGIFRSAVVDDFTSFDESRWTARGDSFPSNLAMFRKENIALLPAHGCRMTLGATNVGHREYAAASLTSKQSYHFGRFEVIMKPARAPGVVTAFFLHRNDPWQEIDVELLGRETTRVLVNVYFNPGESGTKCNFGNRGTPVVIDLTFDAAEDYHRYAIEWEPHEVRWFVDEQLIHVRAHWEPTPVPHLPMAVYCSIWAPRSAELGGELRGCDLPVTSDLRCIAISEWCAAPHASLLRTM